MISGTENSESKELSSKEQEQRARLLIPLSGEENPLRTQLIQSEAEAQETLSVIYVARAVSVLAVFLNNECRDKLEFILSEQERYKATSHQPRSTLLIFDKKRSELLWSLDQTIDEKTKEVFERYVSEKKLIAAMVRVADDYVEKLIYLVRLFITNQNFFDTTFQCTVREYTQTEANKIFDNILELQRQYLETGIEPASAKYLEKFDQDIRFIEIFKAHAEKKKVENPTIYKPKSRDLDFIYGTEFATLYLNHARLEKVAEKFINDDKQKINTYCDILDQGTDIMNYVNELSRGFLKTITGICPIASTPTEFVSLFVKYFDVEKIKNTYETKKTYEDQLQYLSSIYVGAYIVCKNCIKTLRTRSLINMPEVNVSYKVDKQRIRTEIEKLVTQYKKTNVIPVYDEKKEEIETAAPEKPKKQKKKKPSEKPAPQSPPANNTKNNVYLGATKLELFIKSYQETKRFIQNLDESIKPLQEACQQLQAKLGQVSKQDKEHKYLSKERKEQIQDFKNKIETQIVTLKNSLKSDITALEYKDEDKLESNEKAFAEIKTRISELQSNQDKLTKEMADESFFLDHVLPKKNARELAAEAVRLKKEQEREEKKKQAEEERAKKAAKVERPKPSGSPVPLVRVPAPAPAKTEAKKPIVVAKSVPREEKISTRIPHLNQASKNLLYIHKMLEMYEKDLPSEVVHYALLYNIFRCFQSLRMYQTCGGNKQSINADEVSNLRNMIMHHGANTADAKEVIKFAKEIKGKLSTVLAEMKGKNEYLITYELSYEDRQSLLEFTGFISHNNLIIEECALYKKLQRFHESKVNNDDAANIFELVCGKYIPQMRTLLAILNKGNPADKPIDGKLFIENYLFHLQALRMLATMCGEFLLHFKDYSWISLYPFLNNCRVSIRNSVAHNLQDSFNPVDFYTGLNAAIVKIDEKRFLAMVQGTPQTASVVSSPATFFHHGNASGSAMDIKYDNLTLR